MTVVSGAVIGRISIFKSLIDIYYVSAIVGLDYPEASPPPTMAVSAAFNTALGDIYTKKSLK